MSYIDEDGWAHTAHPMPKGDKPHKFARDLREAYEQAGKEVRDVLAYYNSNFDALTCPYSWITNPELRPEPTYGMEVVWKHSE